MTSRVTSAARLVGYRPQRWGRSMTESCALCHLRFSHRGFPYSTLTSLKLIRKHNALMRGCIAQRPYMHTYILGDQDCHHLTAMTASTVSDVHALSDVKGQTFEYQATSTDRCQLTCAPWSVLLLNIRFLACGRHEEHVWPALQSDPVHSVTVHSVSDSDTDCVSSALRELPSSAFFTECWFG